jgi:SecD/SecF fusion protein
LEAKYKNGYNVNGRDVRNSLLEKLKERASKISDDYSVTFDKNDDDKVKIILKEVVNTTDITEYFTGSNALGIWELYTLKEIQPAYSIADQIIKQQIAAKKESRPLPAIDPADSNVLSKVIKANPEISADEKEGLSHYLDLSISSPDYLQLLGLIKSEDTSIVLPVFRHAEVTALIPSDAKFILGKPDPINYRNRCPLYAIKTYGKPNRPFLTDKDIQEARQDYNASNGKPNITFQFNSYGSKVWEDLTRRNISKAIALIIDDVVISAPTVNDVITGGAVEISGNFTISEAVSIAASLGSGRLPVPLSLVSYKLTKSRSVLVNKKMLLSLALCFLLSSVVSYILLIQFKPPVNK